MEDSGLTCLEEGRRLSTSSNTDTHAQLPATSAACFPCTCHGSLQPAFVRHSFSLLVRVILALRSALASAMAALTDGAYARVQTEDQYVVERKAYRPIKGKFSKSKVAPSHARPSGPPKSRMGGREGRDLERGVYEKDPKTRSGNPVFRLSEVANYQEKERRDVAKYTLASKAQEPEEGQVYAWDERKLEKEIEGNIFLVKARGSFGSAGISEVELAPPLPDWQPFADLELREKNRKAKVATTLKAPLEEVTFRVGGPTSSRAGAVGAHGASKAHSTSESLWEDKALGAESSSENEDEGEAGPGASAGSSAGACATSNQEAPGGTPSGSKLWKSFINCLRNQQRSEQQKADSMPLHPARWHQKHSSRVRPPVWAPPGTAVPHQRLPPLPPKPFVLPPMNKEHVGRKTLVLDLDETLVHSSFKPIPNPDYIVRVEIDGRVTDVHVLKRPGVDEFLRAMAALFEIVVFTASLSKYADPLLDLLDREGTIAHRLFRESCFHSDGAYVKDLSVLGRDLKSTLIVDNSPCSYIFHPENAIPISSYIDDPSDIELVELIPYLQAVVSLDDVRGIAN